MPPATIPGGIPREEMQAHVVTHGGYHRGAVGRILPQLAITPPADVPPGFLHQSQPQRRGAVRFKRLAQKNH